MNKLLTVLACHCRYPRSFTIIRIKIAQLLFLYLGMEAILIHPESPEQLKAIKAMLKALKVPFEPQSAVLPSHVKNSLERGLKQYEEGKTISLAQFKEKHFSK